MKGFIFKIFKYYRAIKIKIRVADKMNISNVNKVIQ
jgi:hypothetical protein